MDESILPPYRPNVAMLVYHTATRLLWLGERANSTGHWQFPQGGVDAGSSLEENVIRELVEELGAPPSAFGAPIKLAATHQYDFSTPRSYGRRLYRGQAQTFWIVPFLGNESDFNLFAHEPEFQSWRWCTTDQVRTLANERRMVGYAPALKEFEEFINRTGAQNS